MTIPAPEADERPVAWQYLHIDEHAWPKELWLDAEIYRGKMCVGKRPLYTRAHPIGDTLADGLDDGLVERLYERANIVRGVDGSSHYLPTDEALDREAAEAIAQLRDRLAASERERDEAEDDGAKMLNAEREAHIETSKQAVSLALSLQASDAKVQALLELLVDARKHVPSDCVAKIDAALEQAKP